MTDAIGILSEDASRIVDMSNKSAEIVKMVSHRIATLLSEKKAVPIANLMNILKEINQEHTDINNVIYPIIEALQFQDRLTQNLKNQVKMIRCWLNYREKVRRLGTFGEQQQREFGQELAKCTTTPEERAVLSRNIDGLTLAETEHASSVFF